MLAYRIPHPVSLFPERAFPPKYSHSSSTPSCHWEGSYVPISVLFIWMQPCNTLYRGKCTSFVILFYKIFRRSLPEWEGICHLTREEKSLQKFRWNVHSSGWDYFKHVKCNSRQRPSSLLDVSPSLKNLYQYLTNSQINWTRDPIPISRILNYEMTIASPSWTCHY